MEANQNTLYAEPPIAAPPPAPLEVEATRTKKSAAYDLILSTNQMINREGSTFSPSQHLHGKYVLVYFSAHWCPPCRAFTPKLSAIYESLKAAGKEVEVVFISSDRAESEFKEYLGIMPWLAVPFEDSATRTKLGAELGVSGIPSLVLFDPNGHLINRQGVMAVSIDPKGTAFPWVGELDEMSGGMKAMACMACLCCPCLCAFGIVVGILRCVFCVPCLCPPEQPGEAKK